ncbi:MAG: hypothetical protein ACTHZ9_08595 [Leucobacter sp.]|uniref:hypothetical protein n=1 Tax=Agrococcus casei TaxID=343512 RepID=UPI003F91DF9E
MSVGIASTCFPRLKAQQLATRMHTLGATTTDLAVDRGQQWEVDDPSGALLADLGVEVLTVGLRIEIGSVSHTPESIERHAMSRAGKSIRVFASDDSTTATRRALVAEQLAAFGDSTVLIDTHQGHASDRTLLELTAEFDLGLVLDNEGLEFVTEDARRFVEQVSSSVRVLHLKGFDRVKGSLSTLNRSLVPADLVNLHHVLEPVDPSVPIVLQTRSTTVERDHRLLTHLQKLRA